MRGGTEKLTNHKIFLVLAADGLVYKGGRVTSWSRIEIQQLKVANNSLV
jgi:hypothetical protein